MVTAITGGTGFIGGALAEELVRRSEKVRTLARKISDMRRLSSLGIETAYGDLQDVASLESFLDGCDSLCGNTSLF